MSQTIPTNQDAILVADMAVRLKQLELDSLLEITQAINSNLPEESLYKIFHFTLRANLSIGKLALYVLDKSWECKVHFGARSEFNSKELCESILHITETTLVSSLASRVLVDEFEYIIPIKHPRGVLAYVLVGGVIDKQFAESSLSFIQTISNIMLVAIENKKLVNYQIEQEALRKEMQIAKQVQSLMFPKELPNHDNLQVHASYLPHKSVGGDYYDFVELDSSKYLFCIADVSGKGMPAALLMANFQASLRTLVRQTTDLKEIVRELNFLIKANSEGENFITFFVGLYDTVAQKLQYINAGHNHPFLLLNSGSVLQLDKGSTVLGIFDPLPFVNEGEVYINEGFLFFGYTDGLTELTNEEDEELGVEKLNDFLVENRLLALDQLHANLISYIKNFVGERLYPDDITVLSVRIEL
jgi:phosphoserine phosphatase RsbU/P